MLIVLDGREEIVDELREAPEEVKSYVIATFGALLADDNFKVAIPEHLLPDDASQARARIILARVEKVHRAP